MLNINIFCFLISTSKEHFMSLHVYSTGLRLRFFSGLDSDAKHSLSLILKVPWVHHK